MKKKISKRDLPENIRNNGGVTITSLTIYVIVATVIVTVLVFINANFFSNINDLTAKANIVSESLNFKSAFLRDIKSENEVKVTEYNNNMVRLSNDVKYEIRVLNKNATDEAKRYAIYRNDVQIAKSIVPHTEIDGQVVKKGPYFEYDVDTNTVKVGMKFSDGENVYVENERYIVGREIIFSWADSHQTGYLPILSGDKVEPEVSPSIPADERVYAILYSDGTLQISNHYQVNESKTMLSDYGEVSAAITSGNPSWLAEKNLIQQVNFLNAVEFSSLENLFADCKNLTIIRNITNVKTEKATSAASAFRNCEKLQAIDLASWDTRNITDMSNMFDGCINLLSLDLNSLNTGNVENMSGMLKNCSSLKTLSLNRISTDKVENMSEMFSGCSSLKTLDLNTFNTSSLENMDSMFSNCTSLVSVNISVFDTSDVTNMNKLFYNCRSLASVAIKNFDMRKIKDLSYFFYNCMDLTSVDFGTLDTRNVENMSYMFSNCTRLADIDFGIFNTEAATNMEGMFYNCQALETIDLARFDTAGVTNMSQMFAGCMKLEEFQNLEELDTSSVSNMYAMFKDCSAIKQLDLNTGKFVTTSVTDMSEMFKGCGSLYELHVDGFDTIQVENFSSMFESCANLTELDLQYFNTEKAVKMNRMFMNSSKLTKILVGTTWDSVDREIEDMFTGCGTTVLEKV